MKKIVMMILAVALVALPTTAQTFGDDQPQVQFQSTSTLQGSGSTYTPSPSISADGTAYSPAAQAQSGPRKAAASGTLPGKPTPDKGSDKGNLPLGDAVLPLMLMALAFAGVIALRRRRGALNR